MRQAVLVLVGLVALLTQRPARAESLAAEHLGAERHVLLVAIEEPADAESGMHALRAVLEDPARGGVPAANVKVLVGKDATTTGVREALAHLGALPREATVLVVLTGPIAHVKGEAWWATHDASPRRIAKTALAVSEVRELLGAAGASRVVLLADALDEGDEPAVHAGAGYATLGASAARRFDVLLRRVATALRGEADEDVDGVVDLGELAAYVELHMKRAARTTKGVRRARIDLAGIAEPGRCLLTVEPEMFRDRLEDDAEGQVRRTVALQALDAIGRSGAITDADRRLGRFLLGTLEQGLGPAELELKALFADLVGGRLDPAHLIDALTALRLDDRRTLVVPDAFPTIQAALDTAMAGDTVLVREGRYDEHVVFKNGVRLRGEGRDRTILGMVPGHTEVLLAEGCGWGVIESLQVDGTGGTAIGDWSPDGIHLKGATVRVRDCLVHDCLGAGLYASDPGCRPNVVDCIFERNAQDGACFQKTSGGRIADCIARSNGAVGIQVRDGVTGLEIVSCRSAQNKDAGLGVHGGSSATLTGNDCGGNGAHGILVWDPKTDVVLRGNTCSDNTILGVFVVQQAKALVTGSVCERNKESGIVISGVGTEARLVENQCSENEAGEGGQRAGIVFRDGARGAAASNTCDGNQRGILVYGAGTEAALSENVCRRNAGAGIELDAAVDGKLVRNRCEENGHGIVVARTRATLEGNTVLRNRGHGIVVHARAVVRAKENRCDENGGAGLHAEGRGTRAEVVFNRCASNEGDGIRIADGAAGTIDDNECRANTGYGIVAAGSGTRPTVRRNRCMQNGKAGIGKVEGAAPVVEDSNEESEGGG